MTLSAWLSHNWIEIFGAITGIFYVFLEIRQNLWLWPVGIVTSAVYIWVFFHGKLYADMSLQGYYLVISVAGWWWWVRGAGSRAQGGGEINNGERREERGEKGSLKVTRIRLRLALVLLVVFIMLYGIMFLVLSRLTDSPVPGFDAFLTSLSIVATWMLARKIYEHWYLWIVVNSAATGLFLFRGLYPTVILYAIYCLMSFAGLKEWRRSLS